MRRIRWNLLAFLVAALVVLSGGSALAAEVLRPVTVKADSKKSTFPVHTASCGVEDKVYTGGASAEGPYDCVRKVSVKVPEKGDLYFSFKGTQSITAPMYFYIKKSGSADGLKSGLTLVNEGCTGNYGRFLKVDAPSGLQNVHVNCPEGGTYEAVLLVQRADRLGEAFQENTVSFQCYFYSGADKTLKNGNWQVCAAKSGKGYRYYKIVLKHSGHLELQATQNMNYSICSSKKKVLYKNCSLTSANKRKNSLYLKNGTYYVRTAGGESGTPFRLRYVFSRLGASEYTIGNGKTVTFPQGSFNGDTYHYIKYYAAADGCITVSLPGNGKSDDVALCNASLKVLTDVDAGISKTHPRTYFGVKKGRTYYIRVKSSKASKLSVRVKFKKIKNDRCGSNKAGAVTLKPGRAVRNTVAAGAKGSYWYKFKVDKKRKVSLRLSGYLCSGKASIGINVMRYVDDRVVEGTYTYVDSYKFSGQLLGSAQGAMEPGTYYVRLVPGSNTSGYYILTLK